MGVGADLAPVLVLNCLAQSLLSSRTKHIGRGPSLPALRLVSRRTSLAVSHGRLDSKVHRHLLMRVGHRFAIPFMFSTTLGLAAVALRDDPAMRVLLPKDVSAGLPAPSAAAALLGKSGAAAVLIVLFLAVTSATSAELIAVSSILTYDVYRVTIVFS